MDYGGNILRHGPVDAIQIKDRAAGNGGEAPAKECPECQSVIHAAYSICPDCDYKFPPPENDKHEASASGEGILTGEVIDTEYDVEDVYYSVHTKRGAGEDAPKTMRISYRTGLNEFQSEWVCPEHSGWARRKFEDWWQQRSNDPLPKTAQLAVDIAEAGGVAATHEITVRKVTGEQFDRIINHRLSDWFLAEAGRVYNAMLRDNRATEFDDLANWIRGRGGKITAAELSRVRNGRFPKSTDAQKMLDRLVEAGCGTWNQAGFSKRGRPAKKFYVA